jgi:hypothetical protein
MKIVKEKRENKKGKEKREKLSKPGLISREQRDAILHP